MAVHEALLLCGAAALLLGAAQAFTIRPEARAKRDCLADEPMADVGDVAAKETMYQKMFHNAFSKFLEAMVKCSEEYAQKKRLVNCFDGQFAESKKQYSMYDKTTREDAEVTSLPLNAGTESFRQVKSTVSPSSVSYDLLADSKSLTEVSEETPVQTTYQKESPKKIIKYSKNPYSVSKSKFSDAGEPVGQYSEKQTAIQPASPDFIPKDFHSNEQLTDLFTNPDNTASVERHTDLEPTLLTESYTATSKPHPEFGIKEDSETTQIPTNVKIENKSYNLFSQDAKEIKSDSLINKPIEESQETDPPTTTETSIKNFTHLKNVAEDKFENTVISPSSSDVHLRMLPTDDKSPNSIFEQTEVNYKKSSPKPQFEIRSQQSNSEISEGSDNTTDTTRPATPEKVENRTAFQILFNRYDEPTAVTNHEEVTTAGPKYTVSIVKPVKYDAHEPKGKIPVAESRQDDVILEETQNDESYQKVSTSDQFIDNGQAYQTPEQELTYNASPNLSKNLDKILLSTLEPESTSVTFSSVTKVQSEETVPPEMQMLTVGDDSYESPKTTLQPPSDREIVESTVPKKGGLGKPKDGSPAKGTNIIEVGEDNLSSRHLKTQIPDDESSESTITVPAMEPTMPVTHTDLESMKTDIVTSTVETMPRHTTSRRPSLRPLPSGPSQERHYSSTELSPDAQSNEVLSSYGEKTSDRFGRGSAASAGETNPEASYLASASLRSEEVQNVVGTEDRRSSLPESTRDQGGDRKSESTDPGSGLVTSSPDITVSKPAKIDCMCHMTDDFLNQLKQGVWKALKFEITPH
ncbi:mucin-2-like [Bacillus rossius redtenbacheri]|uniref:mucin-2-like n=1 Tax=Bacillus rossius redtenbacheri TaxID=93214 RepID=UPI002FDD9E62